MLAKEVKRIIRDVFETACQDHGFRRTKRGGLGWYHPLDDHYFVIKLELNAAKAMRGLVPCCYDLANRRRFFLRYLGDRRS